MTLTGVDQRRTAGAIETWKRELQIESVNEENTRNRINVRDREKNAHQ